MSASSPCPPSPLLSLSFAVPFPPTPLTHSSGRALSSPDVSLHPLLPSPPRPLPPSPSTSHTAPVCPAQTKPSMLAQYHTKRLTHALPRPHPPRLLPSSPSCISLSSLQPFFDRRFLGRPFLCKLVSLAPSNLADTQCRQTRHVTSKDHVDNQTARARQRATSPSPSLYLEPQKPIAISLP